MNNKYTQFKQGKVLQFPFVLIGLLCAFAFPNFANAGTSNSYILYDEFPAYGQRAAHDSTSFKMNEAGVTWNAQPVASNNFQIVAAPQGGGDSGGSDGGGGDSGGDDGGSDGGGGTSGGRRPRPPAQEEKPTNPVVKPQEPVEEQEFLEPVIHPEPTVEIPEALKQSALTAQIVELDTEVELKEMTSSESSASSQYKTGSSEQIFTQDIDASWVLYFMIALNIFGLLIVLILLLKKYFS